MVTGQLDDIVADVLGIPPEQVYDSTGPKTASQWTSLRHVQIVAAVEDAFAIRLTPREIRSVRTVGQLRALVLSKSDAG